MVIEPMWCDVISSVGYYGNYEYYVKCTNEKCKLEKHKYNDIYCSKNEAMNKAIESWQQGVELKEKN